MRRHRQRWYRARRFLQKRRLLQETCGNDRCGTCYKPWSDPLAHEAAAGCPCLACERVRVQVHRIEPIQRTEVPARIVNATRLERVRAWWAWLNTPASTTKEGLQIALRIVSVATFTMGIVWALAGWVS